MKSLLLAVTFFVTSAVWAQACPNGHCPYRKSEDTTRFGGYSAIVKHEGVLNITLMGKVAKELFDAGNQMESSSPTSSKRQNGNWTCVATDEIGVGYQVLAFMTSVPLVNGKFYLCSAPLDANVKLNGI